jgi:hypothetical protein
MEGVKMSWKYGFFNSKNGDRLYNADDISDFFFKLFSDGVLHENANSMKVTAPTIAGATLHVWVNPGYAMIWAKYFYNSDNYMVVLEDADTTYGRIDRIVLRLDMTARSLIITKKTGTPAAEPVPPALTRTSAIHELSLAKIAVAAGATAITSEDITDERADPTACGWMYNRAESDDLTSLTARVAALEAGAVMSQTIRHAEQVSEEPSVPAADTLYVIEEGSE